MLAFASRHRDRPAWSRYVEDGQRFLSEGAPRAQVLVLSGCSNPNANACPEGLAESGYDFDFCGPDDLARLTVREGRLCFPSGAATEATFETEKGTFVRPLAHGANFFRLADDSPRTERVSAPMKGRTLEGPWTPADAGTKISFDAWSARDALLPAGLLGPVCIWYNRQHAETDIDRHE